MSMLRIATFSVLALLLCACQSAAPRLTNQQQHDLDGQLILAAYGADHDEVVRLLAAGADAKARVGDLEGDWKNLIGSTTWTPMLACLNGPGEADRYPICVALLDAGADINAADNHGATALYEAIKRPDSETALMLVRRGAEVNTTTGCYIDGDEGSPLWLAVRNGDRAVVAVLLRAGADPESRSVFGLTPLLEAIYERDARMLGLLIEAGADVNAGLRYPTSPLVDEADRYTMSPLALAIEEEYGSLEQDLIGQLVDAGALVGSPDEANVLQVYSYAEIDYRLVRLLIEQGLSPMHRDDEGNTPAHGMAYRREAWRSLRYLLEHDLIDIAIEDDEGESLLDVAVLAGAIENVALLLAHGADPNGGDPRFGGYLHDAIVDGDVALVALLLAYGADPLAKDHESENALQLAEGMPGEAAERIADLLRIAIETRGDNATGE